MSHRFDATLKNMVAEHPEDFAAVFGLPTKEPATSLNIDLSTISAATDVVLAYGNPVREIVDLIFQSGPDAALPGRLHSYNAILQARHGVPVRSDLVLLRPKADGPNLTGKMTYGKPGHRLEFEYGVFRLWREPVESFLHAGLAALPLAILCQLPAGQPLPKSLRDVVDAIHRRLHQEASPAEAARLMTAAFILTGLRVRKDELCSIYQGVRQMDELTAYDEVLEEGEFRGEIKRSHRLLLRLGRKQIGPTNEVTEAELTSIKDLDRLERMTDVVCTAKSWEELLATP